MRGSPARLRLVIACGALCALALPAQAAAHGRTATIALDDRLQLDAVTPPSRGVVVAILDGDRSFHVASSAGKRVLVRGSLNEPMVRIAWPGVWVNAGSPTATGDGLIAAGKHGWVKVGSGHSFIWHDHRLQPPAASRPGLAGRFVVPIDIDGTPGAITGSFFRVSRPALWPWLAAAAALGAGILAALRRRSLRTGLTVGIGVAAGLAALVEVTTFAIRDAPTGGVAWLQVGTAAGVAAALGVLLLRVRGRARVHAAGVVGAVAAAVSLSSLSVFWHGVVISALPAFAARGVCALAIVCGAAAAALSFLPDFDEPVRGRATVVRR
ncbi:MAG TPA: hypothetical protein VGM80_06815 [Gaiellaceae bacterium]